ncbi:MAG: helix-turn-helix domain-containing protein [Clostridiales bacterium]|jgi:DNA-binding XRE family transcriptional regulator|nr:helix-turn-helix domain-containing protein [Clostridiales bacterium]
MKNKRISRADAVTRRTSAAKNKFADVIKQLRCEAELKQSELAAAIGTTQRKVSYWENGKVEPDLDTLIALALFFNVSTDELVGLKEY